MPKHIKILSLILKGSASKIVTRAATSNAIQPRSGKNSDIMHALVTKKVTDPDKDLEKNLPKSVILPTIAANESETVKTRTAGTEIFLLNIRKVTVADRNK